MLYVNIETGKFIAFPGNSDPFPASKREALMFNDRKSVQLQFCSGDGTPFPLQATDTFSLGGDINFRHDDDLMFYSDASMISIVDAAQGIVEAIVDSTSTAFEDKAATDPTAMIVQLKRFVAGDALGKTLLQDTLNARPAVIKTEGAPSPATPGYYNATQINALFAAGYEIQWSVTGSDSDAHTTQTDADRFFRFRNAAAGNSAWSPWNRVFVGPQGERGPSGHYENGLADVTFAPGTAWSKTAVELGITGEPPVAVYDAAGYDVTADSRISVKWSAGTLTVVTPADATGTWRIKFAGGSVNVRERVSAWPDHYLAGRMCHLLDAVNSSLEIADEVRNVAALKLYVKSASAVTGNIVLQVSLNGAETKTVVLPVTATEAMQSITLDAPVTGRLVLTAMTSDARWTLKDTDVVSAIVAQDIYAEVAR